MCLCCLFVIILIIKPVIVNINVIISAVGTLMNIPIIIVAIM